MQFLPCSTIGWLATALCLKFEGFEITHPVRGNVIDDSVQLLEPTVPYQVSAIHVEHVYCSEDTTKLFPIAPETLQLICKHFDPKDLLQLQRKEYERTSYISNNERTSRRKACN